MATKSAELLQPQVQQGEAGGPPAPPPGPPPAPPDHMRSRGNNTVFKSGPLFISSKGIGWTSWKKRWFILTRTSLVFFRSDPSAVPQKGGEVNLTLGGIDLNNSGSVVVKADKKLLTVLFPDGRDGRAFTLKAETMEDLYEWKNALEDALAQAPSASHVMGQNGILRNDQADAANDSADKVTDKLPMRATIIGTPVLLALEDVDGAPSFLEKALRFVEEHGVKVEGILRQAADVEDVERRIREYEQGKTEFSPEEDAHVVADCVKYVLRELPSSPVPASCCNALLEACRTDRGGRVNAMRTAICETFPEPNRHLLQRILMMMQTVASHRAVNRMSSSAVAACMAPLLLRPLLSGDCEIETDFDVGGDGSVQLLKAAAAANHAQAIVITLLEEYENIFGANSLSSELYSDTEESGSESEEATDDDESYEDYDENDDATEESEAYSDDDLENAASETCSDSGKSVDNDLDDDKGSDDSSSGSKSPEESHDYKLTNKLSSSAHRTSPSQQNDAERSENIPKESTMGSGTQPSGEHSMETNTDHKLTTPIPVTCIRKSSTLSNGPGYHGRQWGRTSAKKNLSMESIDYPIDEDDVEIQRLEATKSDLQNRVAEEVKANAVLQANLERRKKALHERRLALEKDVARLQDQLQKESDKREALEAGLNKTLCAVPDTVDEKTKAELQEVAQAQADITNLKQKFDHLEKKLNQQREQNLSSIHDSCSEPQLTSDHLGKLKDKQKDIEAAASSHVFERSTKKHTHLDRTESENEKQQESSSLQNKHAASNIQSDPVHNSNYRSSGVPVNSFAAEPALAKSTPMNSKRSVPRAEGTSTSSALTKLTTRLNFLKERRNQIASELQSVDKSRGGSGQAGPISDKGRRTGPPHSVPYPDKDRGWDTFQSVLEPDKGAGVEGESLQNSEKFRRTDKSHQDRDAGKRLEAQHPQLDRGKSEGHVSYNSDHPQLDRGKSEGHVSYNSDKTRGLGSHPPVASPRTYSR